MTLNSGRVWVYRGGTTRASYHIFVNLKPTQISVEIFTVKRALLLLIDFQKLNGPPLKKDLRLPAAPSDIHI